MGIVVELYELFYYLSSFDDVSKLTNLNEGEPKLLKPLRPPKLSRKNVSIIWDHIRDGSSSLERACPKTTSLLEMQKFVGLLSEMDVKRINFVLINLLALKIKFKTSFRANTIHAVDAYVARTNINCNRRSLTSNHDCF